jgi:hypothetical protein
MANQELLFDTRQLVKPESRAAYRSIKENSQQVRDRIMAFADECGSAGFIRDDLPRLWGCDPNHTSPRVTELVDSGLLLETKRRRKTRAGRSACVLVASEFATDRENSRHSAETVSAAPSPQQSRFIAFETGRLP